MRSVGAAAVMKNTNAALIEYMPAFFKAMTKGSMAEPTMPDDFYLNHTAALLRDRLVLERGGSAWEVKHLYGTLKGGWKSFVADNGVKEGDLLVFRLCGDCRFAVEVFGDEGCSKQPQINKKRKNIGGEFNGPSTPLQKKAAEMLDGEDTESDSDDDRSTRKNAGEAAARLGSFGSDVNAVVVEANSDLTHIIVRHRNKKAKSEEVGGERNVEEQKKVEVEETHTTTKKIVAKNVPNSQKKRSAAVTKTASKNLKKNISTKKSASKRKTAEATTPVTEPVENSSAEEEEGEEEEKEVKEEKKEKVKRKKKVGSRKSSSRTPSHESAALKEAKAFVTTNKCIVIPMKKSSLHPSFYLTLPRVDARKIFPHEDTDFKVMNGDDGSQEWSIKWMGGRCGFSRGWGRFAQDNNITLNDALVIEIVGINMIKMHIFRGNTALVEASPTDSTVAAAIDSVADEEENAEDAVGELTVVTAAAHVTDLTTTTTTVMTTTVTADVTVTPAADVVDVGDPAPDVAGTSRDVAGTASDVALRTADVDLNDDDYGDDDNYDEEEVMMTPDHEVEDSADDDNDAAPFSCASDNEEN